MRLQDQVRHCPGLGLGGVEDGLAALFVRERVRRRRLHENNLKIKIQFFCHDFDNKYADLHELKNGLLNRKLYNCTD